VLEFTDSLNKMSDLVHSQTVPYVSNDIHWQ
jgi:hypothetical protein